MPKRCPGKVRGLMSGFSSFHVAGAAVENGCPPAVSPLASAAELRSADDELQQQLANGTSSIGSSRFCSSSSSSTDGSMDHRPGPSEPSFGERALTTPQPGKTLTAVTAQLFVEDWLGRVLARTKCGWRALEAMESLALQSCLQSSACPTRASAVAARR